MIDFSVLKTNSCMFWYRLEPWSQRTNCWKLKLKHWRAAIQNHQVSGSCMKRSWRLSPGLWSKWEFRGCETSLLPMVQVEQIKTCLCAHSNIPGHVRGSQRSGAGSVRCLKGQMWGSCGSQKKSRARHWDPPSGRKVNTSGMSFKSVRGMKNSYWSTWQDVDKATSAQIALEKHLEQLEAELAFMQKIHKEVMHL